MANTTFDPDFLPWQGARPAPSPAFPCRGCMSEQAGHHTLLCGYANPGDALDLPSVPGEALWDNPDWTPEDRFLLTN